jgi:acetoin utilization deacetylase AcuC-like enzyme
MNFFYSDSFNLPLPTGHRFPGGKYGLLRQKLLRERIVSPALLAKSPFATLDDLTSTHDKHYVRAFEDGSISAEAMRRIGFPWSEHLVRRTRATIGGAIAAVRSALQTGLSGQLAGGTHHAHFGFGSGYCVFNDFAIAAHKAIAENWASRIAIIDLDVHQGDGNAALLAHRPDVFILSIHGANNFPFRKHPSDLDVALPDGTGDADYLRALSDALPAVFAFQPDLVLYQAGVDPLGEDKLGRLNLTYAGLMKRDEKVLLECKRRGIAVSMAIGGGYADPISCTVEAYANTFRVAGSVYGF